MSQSDAVPPGDELSPTEPFAPTPKDPALTLPISLSRTLASLGASRTSPADSSPRYSRLGLHARGGLGEVFVAQDEELPREVALKEIRVDRDDDQSRLRFLIEGTITGSLEHPGVVPVYSLGVHADGRPFYAMRMIRGQTLQQAIAEFHGRPEVQAGATSDTATRGPVDFTSTMFRQLLQRLVTVCQTLQYAHDRGVIHRDLKPANIMAGNYGETLVVDWGLAKILGQAEQDRVTPFVTEQGASPGETLPGQVLGTPAYMSPEQAAGAAGDTTAASDIYALGATLYHLLTGQNPLVHPGRFTNSLKRVQQGDIAPPRTVLGNVPRPLQAICQKAMALKPADRYGCASELASDLERWLADEPLQVYREPLLVRGGRWFRKHPGMAATGATSLTLLLIAAVVVSAITASYSRQLAKAYGQLTASNRQLAQTNRELSQANIDLKTARDLATHNADEARRNEKQANAREAETKAVLDFVETRIFAAARPEGQEGGLGRNVLLRDAVTAAASYVEASFAEQPLIQAQVRLTLAQSLLYLGDTLPALQQYEGASRLLSQHRGRNDRETLAAANDLALCYFEDGQLNKARELFEQTLARQQESLGEKSPDVLDTMHNLATVYEDLGLKAKALELRESTLRQRRAVLGPRHPDIFRSMNDLAYSYLDNDRLEEAIKISEQALAGKRAVMGPTHPETLGTTHTLANMYAAAGRKDAALQLREETLKAMTRQLGPEHPITMNAMHNLANSYVAVGRTSDALQLYEEAVETCKRKVGADHPQTLNAMDSLALQYANNGNLTLAIRLGTEALAGRRTVLGPNHPHTITSMRNLAVAYASAGKVVESVPLFEEAYRRSRDQLGADHPETLDRMLDLALTYERLDRVHETLALRERIFQRQQHNPGLMQADRLMTMNHLAQSYIALRRGDEAEKLLKDVLKSRTEYSAKHPHDADARGYLALTLGQLGEAQQIQLELPAANKSYIQCMEAFETLNKEGAMSPYFQAQHRFFQLQTMVCAKLDEAVDNLDFVAAQSPAEIPLLLAGRLRVLAARSDLAGVVSTAEVMDNPPRNARVPAYQTGVAWSIASALTDDPAQRERYALNAIERLQRVKPAAGAQFATAFAQAYAFAYDPDLAPVRQRDDFQAMLKALPAVNQNPLLQE